MATTTIHHRFILAIIPMATQGDSHGVAMEVTTVPVILVLVLRHLSHQMDHVMRVLAVDPATLLKGIPLHPLRHFQSLSLANTNLVLQLGVVIRCIIMAVRSARHHGLVHPQDPLVGRRLHLALGWWMVARRVPCLRLLQGVALMDHLLMTMTDLPVDLLATVVSIVVALILMAHQEGALHHLHRDANFKKVGTVVLALRPSSETMALFLRPMDLKVGIRSLVDGSGRPRRSHLRTVGTPLNVIDLNRKPKEQEVLFRGCLGVALRNELN